MAVVRDECATKFNKTVSPSDEKLHEILSTQEIRYPGPDAWWSHGSFDEMLCQHGWGEYAEAVADGTEAVSCPGRYPKTIITPGMKHCYNC